MSPTSVDDLLSSAVSLRQAGNDGEALAVLLALHERLPDDPRVNLQCAWSYDRLGLERQAVPFYEKAIEFGLEGEELKDALLGLGSTHRALGEYEKSLAVLDRAAGAYPEDRAIKVFRAIALYNLGHFKEATEQLLSHLIETTSDESVARYRRALGEYAENLDRVWT